MGGEIAKIGAWRLGSGPKCLPNAASFRIYGGATALLTTGSNVSTIQLQNASFSSYTNSHFSEHFTPHTYTLIHSLIIIADSSNYIYLSLRRHGS